jgi:hypothetical protein
MKIFFLAIKTSSLLFNNFQRTCGNPYDEFEKMQVFSALTASQENLLQSHFKDTFLPNEIVMNFIVFLARIFNNHRRTVLPHYKSFA